MRDDIVDEIHDNSRSDELHGETQDQNHDEICATKFLNKKRNHEIHFKFILPVVHDNTYIHTYVRTYVRNVRKYVRTYVSTYVHT